MKGGFYTVYRRKKGSALLHEQTQLLSASVSYGARHEIQEAGSSGRGRRACLSDDQRHIQ